MRTNPAIGAQHMAAANPSPTIWAQRDEASLTVHIKDPGPYPIFAEALARFGQHITVVAVSLLRLISHPHERSKRRLETVPLFPGWFDCPCPWAGDAGFDVRYPESVWGNDRRYLTIPELENLCFPPDFQVGEHAPWHRPIEWWMSLRQLVVQSPSRPRAACEIQMTRISQSGLFRIFGKGPAICFALFWGLGFLHRQMNTFVV